MRNKINILDKQIDRKDLEKFTRKLYICRQKDRPKDEREIPSGGQSKKRNDGPKSITLRREFWRAFKIDLRDSKDAPGTQRYYSGYALGLLKAKKITGEQYNGMIKRLEGIITWEETKEEGYDLRGNRDE